MLLLPICPSLTPATLEWVSHCLGGDVQCAFQGEGLAVDFFFCTPTPPQMSNVPCEAQEGLELKYGLRTHALTRQQHLWKEGEHAGSSLETNGKLNVCSGTRVSLMYISLYSYILPGIVDCLKSYIAQSVVLRGRMKHPVRLGPATHGIKHLI